MKRYIALLRGVNISGKNKVPMAELKQGFEALDYAAVKTWLNSGNVAFSSGETDAGDMAGRIGGMLRERFGVELKKLAQLQKMWALRKLILDAHILSLQGKVMKLEQEIDAIVMERMLKNNR